VIVSQVEARLGELCDLHLQQLFLRVVVVYLRFVSGIMPPYDDWNVLPEEEEEELQDTSVRWRVLYYCSTTLSASFLKGNAT